MLRSSFCRLSIFLHMLLVCGFANANIITVTFEPATTINSSAGITTWQENGMLFEALQGFMLHTDTPIPTFGDHFADNETTYMRDSLDTTINLSHIGGKTFSLLTIDLAEFSDFRAQFTTVVNFTGTRQDGSEVFQAFTLDGIFDASGPLSDFESLTFDSRFTDLISVQIRSGALGELTDGFSMDNVQVQVVPVPAAVWLFGSGLIGLIGVARRKKT